MPTNREKRLAKERQAASFIEKHHGPMADLLQDVTQDIGAELTSLPQSQRDSRLAVEMAYRLDNAIAIPNELVEALDWFVLSVESNDESPGLRRPRRIARE